MSISDISTAGAVKHQVDMDLAFLSPFAAPASPQAAPNTHGPTRHSPSHQGKRAAPYQAKPANTKGQKHLGYLTEWSAPAAKPAYTPPSSSLPYPNYAPHMTPRPHVCPLDPAYQMSVLNQLW